MRFITILVMLGVLAGCGQTAQQDPTPYPVLVMSPAGPFAIPLAVDKETGCIRGNKPCVERSISTYKTALAISERALGNRTGVEELDGDTGVSTETGGTA